MQNYSSEVLDTDDGFLKHVCAGELIQDSLSPNSSLLAAALSTGLLLVGASQVDANAVLLFASTDLISNLKIRAAGGSGTPAVKDVPHTVIPIPAPCLSLHWSRDETLAAAACVNGCILVYEARALASGRTQPLCSIECPAIRQVTWGPCASLLLVVLQDYTLHAIAVPNPVPVLTQLRSKVTSVASSDSLVAYSTVDGEAAAVKIATLSETDLTDVVQHDVDYAEPPAFVDSVAFLAPDTVVAHVLSADEAGAACGAACPPVATWPMALESESNSARSHSHSRRRWLSHSRRASLVLWCRWGAKSASAGVLTGCMPAGGIEDDDHLLLELDSPAAATHITHASVASMRFHNLKEQIRKPASAATFTSERSFASGPAMLVAAFPAPYVAAVVVDTSRSEEHILHFFHGSVTTSDEASGWLEVSNPIEGLKLNLPNTPPDPSNTDELFVPNYAVGIAPVVTHFGELVRHPSNEAAEPAQVRCQRRSKAGGRASTRPQCLCLDSTQRPCRMFRKCLC